MTKVIEGRFGHGQPEQKICSICHQPFAEFGNNAQPINDGRCCDRCNNEVVIPVRIKRMQAGQNPRG